jgi:hypothetical protein
VTTDVTTRERLANGIFDALTATNPLHYSDAADEVADALVASGAVLDAAALADDEAIVRRVADSLATPEPVGDGSRKWARIALRALAAALAETEPTPEPAEEIA